MEAPDHPLDRPAWYALIAHQAGLALGDSRARRFPPDVSPFAAAPDDTPQSAAALAALLPHGGELALIQAHVPPLPEGLDLIHDAICLQMLWSDFRHTASGIAPVALTDSDAADMRVLAELTQPGPFYARTHILGRFVGVRKDGRLVAMAGERLHPAGFTEISAVCTHPDHRGRGFAAALMRTVGANIIARGETPFLHLYADNESAKALYKSLGFAPRREMQFSTWARSFDLAPI
jgi:ribosomal protein S18 acetylase RimI-like enzyme